MVSIGLTDSWAEGKPTCINKKNLINNKMLAKWVTSMLHDDGETLFWSFEQHQNQRSSSVSAKYMYCCIFQFTSTICQSRMSNFGCQCVFGLIFID